MVGCRELDSVNHDNKLTIRIITTEKTLFLRSNSHSVDNLYKLSNSIKNSTEFYCFSLYTSLKEFSSN